MINELKIDLDTEANSEYARIMRGFFKTGKGQYGEGDEFLGIKAPIQRKIASRYQSITFDELQDLLESRIHEYRFTALVILINKYKKADSNFKRKIFEFYKKNLHNINNWDLVDFSAPSIIGDFLLDKSKERVLLYEFAKSDQLWTRRIAIISTLKFIKVDQYNDTIFISKILLNDKHDLIHKAVGWMLREVGKRNQLVEEKFLDQHYKDMPRVMLRYAIERFSDDKRKHYLS